MHFFYLDESGDTGDDLENTEQPVMVLGGIAVRDEGWRKTAEDCRDILEGFLGEPPSEGFELHAEELLSPEGGGAFSGRTRDERNNLALSILGLLPVRKHSVHYVAIDKATLKSESCVMELPFNPKSPYPLAFDLLVSYINAYARDKLGQSARALIVLDEKRQYHDAIERIMYARRFAGAKAHRVKWITEASYPVDSKKNAMIQVSDLVSYCIRRFLEIEHGYRDRLPDEAKVFYASCYAIIDNQLTMKKLPERPEPKLTTLNQYCAAVCLRPKSSWRKRFGIKA